MKAAMSIAILTSLLLSATNYLDLHCATLSSKPRGCTYIHVDNRGTPGPLVHWINHILIGLESRRNVQCL